MSGLRLEKSVPITDPYGLNWFIISESGAGKTSFCASIPDAYFLVTDPLGADCVSVFGGDETITTWDMFKNRAREFLEGNHKFKALVIDDIASAWDLCATHLCKEKEKELLQDVATKGGGFDRCAILFRRVLFPLFASGWPIFITCNDRYDTYESSQTGQSAYKVYPDVIRTARRIVVWKVHQMGRIYMKKVKDNGRMVDRRVISFAANSEFETKDRSTFLAPHGDILLEGPETDWPKVLACFPEGKEGADTQTK